MTSAVNESVAEGGILTHKKDAINWRLRLFRGVPENRRHPVDPNWETGRYIRCHEKARESIAEKVGVEGGYWLFDVVCPKKDTPYVRSAFKITRADPPVSNPVLHFDRFWFVGSTTQEPVKALERCQSTNRPTKMTAREVRSRINEMRSAGYEYCLIGQRPRSINYEDWVAMTDAAQRELESSGETVTGTRSFHSGCSPDDTEDNGSD